MFLGLEIVTLCSFLQRRKLIFIFQCYQLSVNLGIEEEGSLEIMGFCMRAEKRSICVPFTKELASQMMVWWVVTKDKEGRRMGWLLE